MNGLNRSLAFAALILGLAIAPVASAVEGLPTATVTFSGGDVAAGVGFTWGSGILTFEGKAYPFKVNGLNVNDLGVAHIEGSGEVYYLKKIADFNGNYFAAGAGATVAGGFSVAALENQNGVVIHLHSTTQGLKFNFSATGAYITLK